MKVEYTYTACRTKVGDGWEANFFKHKNNTVMVEDMWQEIDVSMSFEDVKSKLIKMERGYNNIKRTVHIITDFENTVEAIRYCNTIPSIIVAKK